MPERDNSADLIEAKLAKEYYKDCVQNLKWALGIIIALVVGFVGYALFKNTREYRQALVDVKDALSQAREACREARGASDKAREYEEKAQERLSSIDKEVASKLKEIEEKGKALVTELIQESEKQREVGREEAKKERKISELWSEGLRAFEAKDYESAAKCFASIVGSKPHDQDAYYNWGTTLSKLAKRKEGAESDELFRQAFEKYKKSVEIEPDKDNAYYNWGTSLSDMAKKKKGDNRIKLLEEAKEKCLKAESIKKGPGAYNLACLSALLGDEIECRKWLETSEKAGTLSIREKAMSDPDLESMRDKEWFKQIRWADDAK